MTETEEAAARMKFNCGNKEFERDMYTTRCHSCERGELLIHPLARLVILALTGFM